MRTLTLLAILLSPAADLDWQKLGQEALERLREYIRLDTSNPPAQTLAAARFIKGLLDAEGIAAEIYESEPGKANLLARLPATKSTSKKALLLLNHLDVVPVDRSRWSVDPFGGEVRDGKIWGRGALDMKSTGMIHLMTLIALKRSGVPTDRDVVFLATADEETGGQMGAAWMIEKHYPRLDPEYVFDEGGFGTRDVFAPGRLVYGVSVADKRVFWIKASAEGPAGHGSQPIPNNANEVLIAAIHRIVKDPQRASQGGLAAGMRKALGGRLAENKFTRAIQRNTCSLTTLRGGVGEPPKSNVIPSRSEATLDCRLLPEESPEAFLSKLRTLAADPRVRFETIYMAESPAPSRLDTPLYKTIERVIQRQGDGAVVTPIVVPFGTDGTRFRSKGAVVYGFTPTVIDLAAISSMHSDEERISVAEYQSGLRLFYEIVKEFLGGKEQP